MGINRNDAKSFEEMAEEQNAQETVVETTKPVEGDNCCDCVDCDCKAKTSKTE